MAITDEDLLNLVAEEARRSVGWDNDAELTRAREQALNYVKGEMPDVVAPPNRSQAVSTDIAEAVETILPDLVEIFTGGDDVAVFIPRGAEDEAAARQETDYVNHVIFNENDGWLGIQLWSAAQARLYALEQARPAIAVPALAEPRLSQARRP
jgi:hypothetical protein